VGDDPGLSHPQHIAYIDPDTAPPVGTRTKLTRAGTNQSFLITTVLKTYEALPATPENVARVR
jgi:hypothetical protein